jgi:hypothetical protein
MSLHTFVVVAPDSPTRTSRRLSCALNRARVLADANPGHVVHILETMPNRGTLVPQWPLARVVARVDPDTRGIVREIDWVTA